MAKVICTLPNASTLINNVNFEPHEKGMISEEISDEQAEAFLLIRGYRPEGGNIAALRDRAAELGITVNSKWKEERLNAEIGRAEASAADVAAATAAATAARQGTGGPVDPAAVTGNTTE